LGDWEIRKILVPFYHSLYATIGSDSRKPVGFISNLPVNIGFAGCGGIAQARDISEALANPHMRLSALCGTQLGTSATSRKKVGLPRQGRISAG